MTKATETALKMLESLPEDAQQRAVDRLRELIEEMRDEARWDTQFEQRKKGLATAARKAREEIAAGKARPMDYGKL
jgi:gamma-glutamyl:cysteine ligase YbdK (ATP-grasp superfamily)